MTKKDLNRLQTTHLINLDNFFQDERSMTELLQNDSFQLSFESTSAITFILVVLWFEIGWVVKAQGEIKEGENKGRQKNQWLNHFVYNF